MYNIQPLQLLIKILITEMFYNIKGLFTFETTFSRVYAYIIGKNQRHLCD